MNGAAASPAGRARRRMGTDERRQQLLQVGAALFAERPYDEVWVEQVAERAGVSRGLLYHYFPSKRDFLLGIVAAEGERLQQMMDAHPDRPPADRLALAVDAYLAYAAGHPHGFRAFHRAAEADAEVRTIKEEFLARTERRIVDGLAGGPSGPGAPGGSGGTASGTASGQAPGRAGLRAGMSPEGLRIVARGWMAFVVEACLQWLDRPALSREQVRDLCVRTLLGAVGLEGEPGARDPGGSARGAAGTRITAVGAMPQNRAT